MRELIIARIAELFKMDPPQPDNQYGRWAGWWFDAEGKMFGHPTKKERSGLIFITDMDLTTLSDEKLLDIFQNVVRRSFAQR